MTNNPNSNEFNHIQGAEKGHNTEIYLISNVTRRLTLSGQQRALIQSLEQKSPELAIIYQGGLWVLNDTSNPDRFSLCAHAMRELMEKLPKFLDVPTKAQRERLKDKVRLIEDLFRDMQKNTKCFIDSKGWNGTIDNHLQKFLLRVTDFFTWFATHHPRRREELNNVLIRLDISGRSLPTPLASLNIDMWDSIHDYFQAIAHHGKYTVDCEFVQWVDALERFLLDRLVPRTFDDFAEIDAILEEEDIND